MHRLVAFLGALASIGVAPWVHAEPVPILAQAGGIKPGSKEAKQKAKVHFQNALKLYKSGSYRQAIDELEQAIEYDPGAKDLHYNKGLVYEKLGEIDLAIAAFKRFTEMETDTAELERVIQIIRRLEGARENVKKEDPVVPPVKDESPKSLGVVVVERDRPEQPPREEKKKGRLDAWVYVFGGASVVALGVGTYYGVRALQTEPRSDAATGTGVSVFELQDRQKRAHDYAVIADIMIGTGVALGGVAALFYFTRDAKPKTEVGLGLGPNGGSLRLGGAF